MSHVSPVDVEILRITAEVAKMPVPYENIDDQYLEHVKSLFAIYASRRVELRARLGRISSEDPNSWQILARVISDELSSLATHSAREVVAGIYVAHLKKHLLMIGRDIF